MGEGQDITIEAALQRLIGGTLSRPMTIASAAGIFGLNRNLASAMIRDMPGVERIGALYRIPLSRMPGECLLTLARRAEFEARHNA